MFYSPTIYEQKKTFYQTFNSIKSSKSHVMSLHLCFNVFLTQTSDIYLIILYAVHEEHQNYIFGNGDNFGFYNHITIAVNQKRSNSSHIINVQHIKAKDAITDVFRGSV